VGEAGWLIETTVLVDAGRGREYAQAWLSSVPPEARKVSLVTVAELLAGCRNRREERRVERELASYAVVELEASIARAGLDLYRRFRLSHGIGFLDCLIAASAIYHGLCLATLNVKHFEPLPGLKVQRPYGSAP
jgi:predicted nucleic acid-binding protein